MLNKIKDNVGARKKGKRLGRGIGSGKGKTSGRGGKGQTARSGVAINGFEGGQMPLYRRLPKRGFKNYTRQEYEVINLTDLSDLIANKKISSSEITISSLQEAGLLKGKKSRVKLLGTGELKARVKVEVHAVSHSAKEKLEKAGSSVSIVEDKALQKKGINVA